MLDIQAKAERRKKILFGFVVGTAVLLVVMLIAVSMSGGDSSEGKAESGGKGGGTSSQEPLPEQTEVEGDDYDEPAEWVELPKGKSEEKGLPVKFPHTPEGAMAMLASSSRGGTTWDTDLAVKNAEVYAHPEDDYAVEAAKESAVGARVHVGVPRKGELPKGASLSSWPIAVQWEKLSDDQVRGHVLVRLRYTPSSDEHETTEVMTITSDAAWVDGDWKFQPTNPEVHEKAPEPWDLGSVEFSDEGWVAIQETG